MKEIKEKDAKIVKYRGVLDLAGKKIPCFVTEDGGRYLSTMGFQIALKMVDENDKQKSGTRLGRHLANKAFQPFLYKGKKLGHYDPTVIYDGNQKINGLGATKLVDFSDGMLEARNHIKLDAGKERIANEAEIIVRAVAKTGIIALVDEATGYQKVREQTLQEILKLYISEEVLEWQKTFHDGFYEQIFRLWNWDFTPESIKKRPPFIGYLTAKLVYENLPEGVLEKIKEKTPKTKGGHWRYRFHQSLTIEVGKEALKKVINSVEAYARISETREEFLKFVKKGYPSNKLNDEKEALEVNFDQALKTAINTPPLKLKDLKEKLKKDREKKKNTK